ncbi:MAG: GNAT family N-acyltransferase [Verrucomicrobiota bacterium]
MNSLLEPVERLTRPLSPYRVRLARNIQDIEQAQRLRFAVFNLELKEGLDQSLLTGLDADPFDGICDHLLVEHVASGEVVGTYRLQTGTVAGEHRGYYSEQEFDFRPLERLRPEMIELGRACVHREHRNFTVLGLLWKGIAGYARSRGGRYLCGCSSLNSQDAAVGASAYADLCRQHLVGSAWRTKPRPAFHCSLEQLAEESPKIPKLLRAYLSLGAKICGPPALDRTFKTIDFLTLLDLEAVPALVRHRLQF